MLRYVDQKRNIAVYRPKATGSSAGHLLLGTIDKRSFSVKMVPDSGATADEAQELEAFAVGLKGADSDRKEAVLQFPPSSRRAIRFYVAKASDIDKQLISHAVRQAVRAIRKQTPPTAEAPANPAAAPSMSVTPEVLAAALYKALAQNASGKVMGEPNGGKKTEIRGFWDLNSVARALLMLA